MNTKLILAAFIGSVLQCCPAFGAEAVIPDAQPSTPQIEKLTEAIAALTKRLQAVEERVEKIQAESKRSPQHPELDRLKQFEEFVKRDEKGRIVAGTFYCGSGYQAFQVFANLNALSNIEKLWFGYESTYKDSFLSRFVKSRTLRVLHLASSGFTDGSIGHVKHIQSLEVLDITGSSITEKGVQEMRTARPNVKVIRQAGRPVPSHFGRSNSSE